MTVNNFKSYYFILNVLNWQPGFNKLISFKEWAKVSTKMENSHTSIWDIEAEKEWSYPPDIRISKIDVGMLLYKLTRQDDPLNVCFL